MHINIHTYVCVCLREREKGRINNKTLTTRVTLELKDNFVHYLIENTDLQIPKLSTSPLVTIYKIYYLPEILTVSLYKRAECMKIRLHTKNYLISNKESG